MRRLRRPGTASADRRDLLLDAAAAEFAANGFEATSVQRIASAAGVSKAKVFYYFDNKDDLYARVLARALEPLFDPLEKVPPASSAESFWSSLEAGLAFAFEFAESDSRTAELVRGLYRRGADSDLLRRLLDRPRSAIDTWLRDGQRLGAVRTDLPVPILAEAMVGAIVHVDRWLASLFDADETADAMISSASVAALARDALQQRTPAECEIDVAYAAGDVSRVSDGYLDDVATVMQQVTIRDARQRHPAASFDREGFELMAAPFVFESPPDDREARAAYGTIEAAVQARLEASFVRVFDHTVRHSERTPGGRPPIRVVHADYGRAAGTRRLAELVSPDELRQWEGARIVVANLWQSVAGVVHSTPLGFVDIDSVRDEDFVPVTVQYPDRVGEIGYYRPSDRHEWSWFPFMKPSESVLFKTFDGTPAGRHWSCPHAAFTAPSSPADLAGQRTSIEFRILLAFDREEGGEP